MSGLYSLIRERQQWYYYWTYYKCRPSGPPLSTMIGLLSSNGSGNSAVMPLVSADLSSTLAIGASARISESEPGISGLTPLFQFGEPVILALYEVLSIVFPFIELDLLL